eukprot:4085764-Ditylum_brightwellii.AAC.1
MAAQEGHCDIISLLISNGADINKQNNGGTTPLYVAAQQGYCDIVSLLLSNGADINRCDNDGTTPLTIAIAYKQDKVESLLRAAGASMPTDVMNLETVDDVVLFIVTLNIGRNFIPQMKTSIRDKNINAEKFFALQDATAMLDAL